MNVMARRVPAVSFVLLLVCVVAILGSVRPGEAASYHQIVQPGDVSTPTATFTIILVPTPTATQVPVSPIGESGPRELQDDGDGAYGAEGFAAYVVRPGDTLLSVAVELGVDVGDLPCAIVPTFRPDLPLVIGDSLEVPPSSWQCHRVAEGESLTQIAAHYGIDPTDVIKVRWNQLDANALGESVLAAGTFIRIPPQLSESADGGFLAFMLDQPLSVSPMTAYAIGGTKPRTAAMVGPLPRDWPFGSGNFMWPVFGWMSQGYRSDHRAIDIASTSGTFVTAADRGVVIRAGWNDQGYGTFVVIDHKIDYITLYAHLSEVFVQEGDVVAQGQVIGTIGSTGNSTGPHLHFEIRDFGRLANPLDLLIR